MCTCEKARVITNGSMLTDSDIRAELKLTVLSLLDDEPETVVIDELGICQGEARVDLALVNGKIHGYEIKSDRDSLRRLAKQVDLYGKVVDQATLVVGQRHFEAAKAVLPEWWGLLYVERTSKGIRFTAQRQAQTNPGRDARALVEFLWLEDAIMLLERHGLDRGVRSKPRRIVWDRVCDSFDIEVIGTAVRAQLKARAMLPIR
jgi:hypothetical protein